MDSQNTTIFAISSLCTIYIIKKLNLDSSAFYGLIYSTVIGIMTTILATVLPSIGDISFYSFHDMFHDGYLISSLLIIILLVMLFIPLTCMYIQPKGSPNYVVIKIYDNFTINKIVKYFVTHNNYVNEVFDYTIGDLSYIVNMNRWKYLCKENYDSYDISNNDFLPTIDKPIRFYDKEYKLNGYIIFKNYPQTIEGNKKITIYIPYLEMHILKSDMTNSLEARDNYVNLIKKRVRSIENNNVHLKYIKVIKGANHTISMYEGKNYHIDDAEKKYIHTFFHQKRDSLWDLLKKIYMDPEYFIKLGQSPRASFLLYGPPGTGKSTFAYRVAMSLKRHIVSIDLRDYGKKNIYQIVQAPNFSGSDDENGHIVLLEEFDVTVKELNKRSIAKNKADNENKYMISNVPAHVNKKDSNDKNKIDLEEPDFFLKDLLELLQGPVPLHGSILIATTNEFDTIYEMSPELFRPGRLTPIYFGYVSREIFHEITEFYFGQTPQEYLPETIEIPTSHIIELALECLISKGAGFEKFMEKIISLLK